MAADGAVPHPLDRAVRLDRKGEDVYLGSTSTDYWNMAGPFGGITAAILLKAVMDHPRRRGRPLAQTVNFCAAIAPGSFEVRVALVRDGRSTQHWQVTLLQGDVVAATANLVSGPSRETWSHQPASRPSIAPLDAVPIFATGSRSAWVGRYEMRFALGAPSRAQGSSDQPASAETRLWIRDEPPRPLDYVALSALADSFIVRILQVRGDLPPVATVTLSTYFIADEAELIRQGSRSIIGVADARAFKHGFNDQSAELWSDGGDLLAVSHQLVWFKS
jgi:acyl-CoA thioesterase